MEDSADDHLFVARSALAVILIILSCLGVAGILKKYSIDRYLPASTTSIAIGFGTGAILNYTSLREQNAFSFSPSLFFFLLLPPIMIEAGYALRRKDFFKNITMICLYAFLGTFLSCTSFAGILYAFSLSGVIPLKSILECFLFGALIASTDPVAVLSILNLPDINVQPTLHSVIFGESILNDAVSIVLFNTFKSLIPSECIVEAPQPMNSDCEPKAFNAVTVLWAFGYFMLITLGSLSLGLVIALVVSFITKRINFAKYSTYEVLLVILVPWGSYFCAEAVQLSGIMSVFFTSVGMAHYTYYNISENARLVSHGFVQSLASTAETFVFAYIGIRVGLSLQGEPLKWNVPLIFISLLLVFVSRACHIFPLATISNCFRPKTNRFTFKMQITMWWAGLRGAFALAVSLGFPIFYQGTTFVDVRDYVVTSTLVIVLTTTLIGGGTTIPLLNCLGVNRPRMEPYDVSHNGYDSTSSTNGYGSHDDSTHPKQNGDSLQHAEDYAPAVNKWRRFDRTFMRRWFGGNPESSLLLEDHTDSTSLLRAASHYKPDHNRLSEIDISLPASETKITTDLSD